MKVFSFPISILILGLSAFGSGQALAFDSTASADAPEKHPEVIPGRQFNDMNKNGRGASLPSLTHADFIGNEFGTSSCEQTEKVASEGYNYLEGPDGTTWYYTAKYTQQDIYYNEYYTDHILETFTFNIYNNRRQLIGTVKDKVRYAPNEIRDRECIVDPQVSLRFFNTDDKPEIMVYHAMNTDIYVNHYYYSVYTVGGEKDEEGYDKEIARIEGRCVETINTSSTPNSEDYLFTFVQDPVINFPSDDPEYVQKLNELSYKVTTYKKAENDVDGPRVFLTKDIGATRIPGDTTEGIYFMTKRYSNRLFFIYSQYELPYFIDPRGSATDERATPDNSLLIEVYEAKGDEAAQISSTTIPVNEEPSTDKLMYTFLSIGSVAYTNDVDMKFHGTPDAPAFIVARDVAAASDIDNMKSSYYIYDNDGNLVQTIAEDTDSMQLFNNGDTEGPIAMFVKFDENGDYIFVFAYLYSGRVLGTVHQGNNGDPLYATCVPVKVDGEYKFVFEMQKFTTDSKGNLFARVAWFGQEREPERIDKICIGTGVQAAMVYLTTVTLNPTLFDKDDAQEYAVLVKRTSGNTTRNEYLIVDDDGGRYATYSADDGKGQPTNLSIYPGSPNRMIVTYERGSTTVTLPFTTPSTGAPDPDEEEEEPGEDSAVNQIEIDSDQGAIYYDLQGRQVSNPEKGIYIRRNGSIVSKVIVK